MQSSTHGMDANPFALSLVEGSDGVFTRPDEERGLEQTEPLPESTTQRDSDLGLETPETLLDRLTPNPRPFVWNVVDCAAMHVAVRPAYRCERAKIGDQVLIYLGRRRIESTRPGG
jgi:hypothetical protein